MDLWIVGLLVGKVEQKKVFGYQRLPGVTRGYQNGCFGVGFGNRKPPWSDRWPAKWSRARGSDLGRERRFELAPSLVLAGRLDVIQNNRLIREPPEIYRGHTSLTS